MAEERVRHYLESLPQETHLRAAMAFRYPPLPSDVKEMGVFRPLPPLNHLCPSGGYTKRAWQPDVDSWLEHFPDEVNHGRHWLGIGSMNLLGQMAEPFLNEREMFRFLRSSAMPRSEGCIVSTSGGLIRPFMFCLVDFHNLPAQLDLVLDRLMNYMEVTGTRAGLVTCMTSTWMCKRDRSDSLLVSMPLDNPLVGIGFLLEEARKDPTRLPIITKPLASFDYGFALRLLEQECDSLRVFDAQKIVNAAVIGDTFKLEDLSDVKLLPLAPQNRFWSVAAMRARYQGREVVVKTRDLTCPYYGGFRYGVLKLIMEVDAYIRLRKLQGHGVPNLLSWGFMKGCMFTFVMLSDEGRNRVEDIELRDLGNPKRKQVLPRAMEILHEIHKRGILLRKINITSIVTKQDAKADFSLKLVGLGDSRLVQVMSQEWFEHTEEEANALKTLIQLLETDFSSKSTVTWRE